MISHPTCARTETRGRLVHIGCFFLISLGTNYSKGYRKEDMQAMRLTLVGAEMLHKAALFAVQRSFFLWSIDNASPKRHMYIHMYNTHGKRSWSASPNQSIGGRKRTIGLQLGSRAKRNFCMHQMMDICFFFHPPQIPSLPSSPLELKKKKEGGN